MRPDDRRRTTDIRPEKKEDERQIADVSPEKKESVRKIRRGALTPFRLDPNFPPIRSRLPLCLTYLPRLGSLPFANVYSFNALTTLSIEAFGISNDETLFIIGNPPYNDTTSIIRNGTKKLLFDIDPGIQSRDLSISFLLSYQRLQADYVCVLHPLSYLIYENFGL